MISYQEARKLAVLFSAIGETTRMLILYRLVESERNVTELADLVGIPLVNMSHHLGVMKQAGLLDDHKDGRKVVYSIKPELFTPGTASSDVLGVLRVHNCTIDILKNTGEEAKKKGKASHGQPARRS